MTLLSANNKWRIRVRNDGVLQYFDTSMLDYYRSTTYHWLNSPRNHETCWNKIVRKPELVIDWRLQSQQTRSTVKDHDLEKKNPSCCRDDDFSSKASRTPSAFAWGWGFEGESSALCTRPLCRHVIIYIYIYKYIDCVLIYI